MDNLGHVWTTGQAIRALAVVLMTCTIITACTTNPAARAKELAAQVQVGTTTRADVLQLFGFPTKQKKETSDGQVKEVWTYVYSGQGTTESSGLTVTFDEKGVVTAIAPGTQVGPASSSNPTTPISGTNSPRRNR